MDDFEKDILKRKCNHPIIKVVDLKKFDSICEICNQRVTQKEIIENIERRMK